MGTQLKAKEGRLPYGIGDHPPSDTSEYAMP